MRGCGEANSQNDSRARDTGADSDTDEHAGADDRAQTHEHSSHNSDLSAEELWGLRLRLNRH